MSVQLAVAFALVLACGIADAQNSDPTVDVARKIDREDNSILKRHNPLFFAYGQPTSKLQLSFKSALIKEIPLYFGYTQVMFWALNQESKPFRDLTFNPELFYRWQPPSWGLIKSLDFGLLCHNSNGKDGPASRSVDRQYIRMNFEREGRRWLTRLGLQVSFLHSFDERNADLQKYIGPLGLNFSFIQLYNAWIDKSEFSFLVSPGGKFANHWESGGYQLSWSFRLGGINLVPAFYLQYYFGYAESLLNYNSRVSEFRGGLVL